MLFAYIKAVRRGVAAEFFAVRNGETELIEVMVITDAAIFSNDTQSSGTGASKIRKALNRLDRWDRDLVRYKAVHGWTFPDIRAEFRRQGYPIELGALRMRYSRALAQLKRDLGQSFFY